MSNSTINIPNDIHVTGNLNFSDKSISDFIIELSPSNTLSGYRIKCDSDITIDLSKLNSINTKGIYYIFESNSDNNLLSFEKAIYNYESKKVDSIAFKLMIGSQLMVISDPNNKVWHIFNYKGSITLVSENVNSNLLESQITFEPIRRNLLTIQDNIGHDIFSGGVARSGSSSGSGGGGGGSGSAGGGGSSSVGSGSGSAGGGGSDSVWDKNVNFIDGAFNSKYEYYMLVGGKRREIFEQDYNKSFSPYKFKLVADNNYIIFCELMKHKGISATSKPNLDIYAVLAGNSEHFGGQFSKKLHELKGQYGHVGTQEEAFVLSGLMPNWKNYEKGGVTTTHYYNTGLSLLGSLTLKVKTTPGDLTNLEILKKPEYILIAAPDFRPFFTNDRDNTVGQNNIGVAKDANGKNFYMDFIRYQLALVFEKVLSKTINNTLENDTHIYMPIIGGKAFCGNVKLYGALYAQVVLFYSEKIKNPDKLTITFTWTKYSGEFYTAFNNSIHSKSKRDNYINNQDLFFYNTSKPKGLNAHNKANTISSATIDIDNAKQEFLDNNISNLKPKETQTAIEELFKLKKTDFHANSIKVYEHISSKECMKEIHTYAQK